VVCFNVKHYAGTEFIYPADFLPCIAAASGFNLGPGESAVLKARWPAASVPSPGTHACLVAAVLTRSDHPAAGRHVAEHHNLAQKNLTIVDLAPNDSIVLPFVLAHARAVVNSKYVMELVRPKKYPTMKVTLFHRSGTPFGDISKLVTHQPAVEIS